MNQVLIVEDDASLVLGLSAALEADGHVVRVARDGPEGLRLALEEHPDLILLDLMLPGMSGFEVCKRIRDHQMRCPVIMLTSRTEENDRVFGLELGADDYVTKPFSLRELLARVRAHLRRAEGGLAEVKEQPRQFRFGEIDVDFDRLEVHRGGAPPAPDPPGVPAPRVPDPPSRRGPLARAPPQGGLGPRGQPDDAHRGQSRAAPEEAHRARPRAAALHPDRARGGLSLRSGPSPRGGLGAMTGARWSERSAAVRSRLRAWTGRRSGARAALLALSLLLALSAGDAPAGQNGAPDPLATLKVGHWVRLDGPVQPDSIAFCEELRVLAGDFLDDDWSLRGFVTAVDTSRHEIVIGGIRIQVTEDTGYDSPKRSFRRFSDLRAGMLIEVEGAYLKNRRFLAREVDDESDEVPRTPWARNRIRIVAKVERVDAHKRLVTAMGFVYQLTDRTRIRSAIE